MRKPAGYMTVIIIVIAFAAASMAEKGYIAAESGLMFQDLEVGSGETAEVDKIAVIHFSGWIDTKGMKGDLIFTSRDHGKPIAFKVGTARVIRGWNIGVIGMKVGGKRRLMVPSHLGYGNKGSGDTIPPNANLIFDIELIEVK
jgi:FKBP-type peptidyl-prolyl cis-trans isomerase